MGLKGQTLLAYVAGIVDGEGCIGICGIKREHNLLPYTNLRVSVVNTNEWLIEFLKFHFGGSHISRLQRPKPSWKPTHEWVICSIKAVEFLKLILPYLQIKKPQAELAINFQLRKLQRKRPMSSEYKILNEADRVLMHSLNKRGIDTVDE